jgi:hypothetical protein
MYLEFSDQTVANNVAIEVNQFTQLLKNVATIPIEVFEDGGKWYVKAVEQYDYSSHAVDSVVQELPSIASVNYVQNFLKGVQEFSYELMERFKAENIATGISQTPGATAGVLEVMKRKFPISGAPNEGVSLYDALTTDSLTTADDVIDAMIADIQANPSKYSAVSTWINEARLTAYKNEIIAFLA